MKWKRRERERKKIEGRIPRVEVSANICHSCAGIFASSHSFYPPFLVLRWACYHCTDRFLGWKIANRFGLAWISRGKDGDCIDFSIRDGFSYLERIINGPRFSAFPTTDRLVRSVKYSRNCFLPFFFFFSFILLFLLKRNYTRSNYSYLRNVLALIPFSFYAENITYILYVPNSISQKTLSGKPSSVSTLYIPSYI